MNVLYYVRTVLADGSVRLSHPFQRHEKACQWARIARRDTRTVLQTLVICRPVLPIDTAPPTRPAA